MTDKPSIPIQSHGYLRQSVWSSNKHKDASIKKHRWRQSQQSISIETNNQHKLRAWRHANAQETTCPCLSLGSSCVSRDTSHKTCTLDSRCQCKPTLEKNTHAIPMAYYLFDHFFGLVHVLTTRVVLCVIPGMSKYSRHKNLLAHCLQHVATAMYLHITKSAPWLLLYRVCTLGSTQGAWSRAKIIHKCSATVSALDTLGRHAP